MKQKLKISYRPVAGLVPYARNARTHSDEQVAQIAASIREFGWTNPVLIDEEDGIIAGHGRVLAAQRMGLPEVPCITLAGLSAQQKKAYVLADNRLALNAGWDEQMLATELSELGDAGFDLALTGFDRDELADLLAGTDAANAPGSASALGTLAERFMIPPFSVLNAREGWWQDRKRAWISLGIRSEVGRGANALGFSDACNGTMGGKSYDEAKHAARAKTFGTQGNIAGAQTGTSIFDPVLCELAYLWFSPPGGLVLDPFAGGSVRGVVAGKLGRQYVGQDLRAEQVAANEAQADVICKADAFRPRWIVGDSRAIDVSCADVHADLVFTCPPYADLEVYSDDPADISTLEYAAFREAYCEIVTKACSRLKADRFACVVVGEVRGRTGAYYNFVGDTIAAFTAAGLAYYNEAILVTAIGSLPIRVGKQFSASRKFGKTHQNLLVFVKGDPMRATAACGHVAINPGLLDPDEAQQDAGDEYGERMP